jgi:2-phospho-L-lactate guanylyltransferase
VRWALVVPVKRLRVAKSRLAPLAGPVRTDLALAMALDTVAAALDSPAVETVVVVTDEPHAADEARRLGAHVVSDVPDAGLNPALEYAAAAARAWCAVCGIAALSADLPALRPAELGRALDAAARHRRAFVPDVSGTGTTLLCARPGEPLAAAYGAGSRERHRRSGAVELRLRAVESVRRDVDTPDDLAAAVRLGVGPRTRAALARLRTPVGRGPGVR